MSMAMTDHIHHPQAFHAMSQSQYSPVFNDTAMTIDVDNHAHHMPHLSTPISASANSSLVYGQASHMAFSTDDRQQHFTPHQSHFHAPHSTQHSPSPHTAHSSEQTMAVNPSQLRRSGPQRILTRRQARAQASQLGIDPHGANGNAHQPQEFYNQEGYMLYTGAGTPGDLPRPQTPTRLATENTVQHQRSISDMHLGTHNGHILANMSPPNPSTPASSSSSFSNYGFHPYATHSRSTSSSTHPRSNSPAMSVMSVATSRSSSSSTRRPPLSSATSIASFASTPSKPKKRLVNRERKEICEFAIKNPDTRQEDIATRYGVERSTVSKILKQKEKWLSIAEGENNLVAKHRPSKFPEIEVLLQPWLEECRSKRTPISDSMIRSKAREVARSMGIGDDKFKASSGWVENYKHRQGIRKGIWEGKKIDAGNDNDNFDVELEAPDLVDELQAYSEESQKYVEMRDGIAAKEHIQLKQEADGNREMELVQLDEVSTEVTAAEPSQMHTEEPSVSPVSPDQWPPPPPESMGIAPHETYREPPAQLNEQHSITLTVPHMTQALQEVHIPQAEPLPSTDHHDMHAVYQHENTVNEMMSAHDALQDHPVAVDNHDIDHAQSISLMDYQQQHTQEVSQQPQQRQQEHDPPYEQNWNLTPGSAGHISAQQASQAAAILEMYIKAQPNGYCTVHELNVFDSLQKAIQSDANAP